jgi:hypothetical protein
MRPLLEESGMNRKPTALAELDILSEGLAQQDGLAERLARHRAMKARATAAPAPPPSEPALPKEKGSGTHIPAAPSERNAWRRGKGLIQVAIDEDIHIELGIIGKRRRLGLSQLTRNALNLWLETHSYTLRIPD